MSLERNIVKIINDDLETTWTEFEWKNGKIIDRGSPNKLIKKHGTSHSPTFTVSLKVLNYKLIKASGSSIQEAEKNAALVALEMFNEAKTS